MAITTYTTPDDPSAGYRQVIFEASSDDANITRMIADIYVDGVYETSIEKSPTIGTSDQFKFDVSLVAQDFLTHDLNTTISDDVLNFTNSAKNFTVDLFEVLDTTSDTLETNWGENGGGSPEYSGSAFVITNTTLQHTETQNLDDWLCANNTDTFLTNRPFAAKIYKGHPIQLDFLTTNTSIVGKYTEFDSSGSDLGTTTIQSGGVSITRKKGAIIVDTGSLQSNTDYVKIWIQKKVGESTTDITSKHRVNIKDYCEDTLTLYWQNPLGGIDWHSFNGAHEAFRTSERNVFEKFVADGFAVTDRGMSVHNVNSDEGKTLFTSTEKEATVNWLRELVSSNEVYVYDGTNFLPIIITSNEVIYDNTFDPIFQFAVQYVEANKPISQKN